ncbi:MAG: DNA phosphorothioation-associated protein 4 [Geminocystis sp.]|nr:DNA phosphorothioation-associated protein 4 [Geminocystis sp.]HIK37745.1 DNA phosphorothioation-associated protein 4 [Geminocystis sp. M7585_C2015_104]MCS7148946.1 DNA phosphorothioation-associated protein 4 [Geminocystis sp.]MCX8077431.1 DNA phosphorothioation-associated protein 4 [Geminocystis sp.]MDW8117207.1 DNA phosphorothioation-associated protein 4 [Geminocystis sp.]
MRIHIAEDKAGFLQSLVLTGDNPQGVFLTYADAVVFAASLGILYHHRVALTRIAKEPSPISIEIFVSRGYGYLFSLLKFSGDCHDGQYDNFNNGGAMGEDNIRLFEEYANGGLEILQQKLKGAIDYTERILLMISREGKFDVPAPPTDFDLRYFLS